MNSPLKYGHRGAMAYIAENTIPSVKKALELKVDGIEIDVHKCASGELVVFHDFTLDRMTNRTGEVKNYSWSQLQDIKIDGGYSIPKLEQILDVIDKKCIVNIELKGIDTAVNTSKVIDDYIHLKGWDPELFLVSSFQHQELKTMQHLKPDIDRAVLTKASVEEAIEIAKFVKANTIHPNFALLSQSNIREAKSQGFRLNTWTVNDQNTIERMRSYGVDGIISDYPDRL